MFPSSPVAWLMGTPAPKRSPMLRRPSLSGSKRRRKTAHRSLSQKADSWSPKRSGTPLGRPLNRPGTGERLGKGESIRIPPVRQTIPSEKVQESCRCQKKALRISSGALLCRAEDALVNFNKVRIACADHPLRKHEAVHVNRDPAAIHEHEVRVADQPEMVRPE